MSRTTYAKAIRQAQGDPDLVQALARDAAVMYQMYFTKPPARLHGETKAGRLPWKQWKPIRAAVLDRDVRTCAYCGQSKRNMEVDHVAPLNRGGTNATENLVAACETCNTSKGTRTLIEWLLS